MMVMMAATMAAKETMSASGVVPVMAIIVK